MDFSDNHTIPTIRIQKIELNNFKCVSHGEIEIKNGRKNNSKGATSNILGIYGQNGSGKSAVIEALAILKRAMSGDPVPTRYSECIASGAEYAALAFTFDLHYSTPTDYNRTVVYSFKISAVSNDTIEDSDGSKTISSLYPTKVKLFDETISASGFFNGKSQKMQDILTTTGNHYPIGPVRKISEYVGDQKESAVIDLEVNKRTAIKNSCSFIFLSDTLDLFTQKSDNSEYAQLLFDLSFYAHYYLHAIDSRSSGMGSVTAIPLSTRLGTLALNLLVANRMPQNIFDDLVFYITKINTVLPELISNLRIELKAQETLHNGKKAQEVNLYSRRNDTLIPLRDESAGILKLISILSLIIASYNDESVSVAIDELDAGIYEYILGEILSGLEAHGKGQLIFTSHNLRPLEVLKKEDIVFTTSSPDNRYLRLKGVAQSNNLRNVYFREILSGTQTEPLYSASRQEQIVQAFLNADDGITIDSI